MIILNNGKIILNGVECNDPYQLFFNLKDRSEQGYLEINLENELLSTPSKRG